MRVTHAYEEPSQLGDDRHARRRDGIGVVDDEHQKPDVERLSVQRAAHEDRLHTVAPRSQ